MAGCGHPHADGYWCKPGLSALLAAPSHVYPSQPLGRMARLRPPLHWSWPVRCPPGDPVVEQPCAVTWEILGPSIAGARPSPNHRFHEGNHQLFVSYTDMDGIMSWVSSPQCLGSSQLSIFGSHRWWCDRYMHIVGCRLTTP